MGDTSVTKVNSQFSPRERWAKSIWPQGCPSPSIPIALWSPSRPLRQHTRLRMSMGGTRGECGPSHQYEEMLLISRCVQDKVGAPKLQLRQ
jgi:hypothetical protein